jgi:hypothetical protein
MSFWNGHEWGGDTPPATDVKREGRAKHVAKAALEASLITALAFGLIAGSTFAAKGGNGGGGGHRGGGGSGTTGTYTVTVSPAGPYTIGETVSVTTNAPIYTDNSGWITLVCTQGGVVVASATHANFPDGWYYDWPFSLGPSGSWSSGDAICTINVLHGTAVDASTSFLVDG